MRGLVRLALVLAGLVLLVVVLGWLWTGESLSLPAHGTAQRAMLAAEIADTCKASGGGLAADLCREQILAPYRLAFYGGWLGFERFAWIYALAFAGIALAGLWAAGSWVVRGFSRSARRRPI